ncbi:hypothetical protein TNCV_3050561 [Trichonephila clavipes]|nr:hypothetical protein TNCV_3050561 [Trichonephila clavipes]
MFQSGGLLLPKPSVSQFQQAWYSFIEQLEGKKSPESSARSGFEIVLWLEGQAQYLATRPLGFKKKKLIQRLNCMNNHNNQMNRLKQPWLKIVGRH